MNLRHSSESSKYFAVTLKYLAELKGEKDKKTYIKIVIWILTIYYKLFCINPMLSHS